MCNPAITKAMCNTGSEPIQQLKRLYLERIERIKMQPTELWFRPADADLETVKQIVRATKE